MKPYYIRNALFFVSTCTLHLAPLVSQGYDCLQTINKPFAILPDISRCQSQLPTGYFPSALPTPLIHAPLSQASATSCRADSQITHLRLGARENGSYLPTYNERTSAGVHIVGIISSHFLLIIHYSKREKRERKRMNENGAQINNNHSSDTAPLISKPNQTTSIPTPSQLHFKPILSYSILDRRTTLTLTYQTPFKERSIPSPDHHGHPFPPPPRSQCAFSS